MEKCSPDTQETLSVKLQERIKELQCLYDISTIGANPGASLDQIIQDITERIPTAFQHPEHTCVRTTIGNMATQTVNFEPCRWRLDTAIAFDEKVIGSLEIGYIASQLHDTPPFLDEEKKLLQEIATRIGIIVHGNTLKDAIKQSEKKYRTLVDNAHVGIVQSTVEGELLYANNTALRMFGYESLGEAKAVRAAPAACYRKPEDRKIIIEMLTQTGKVSSFEVECMTKTGEPIVALFSATLEKNIITGMTMDITARKRSEQSLIENERRLIEAQRIGHVGSWDWDVTTGGLYWSDETYRIFGLEPQQHRVTYKTFLASIHPNDLQAVEEAVNKSLSDPSKSYSTQHRIILPDGREHTVHERGEVTFDKNGEPVRMMGSVHDITELKQSENEIKRLRDMLEAENIYLREEIEEKEGYRDIIGTSETIKSTLRRCRQVARMKTTILLSGETGTGKGIFARYIHQQSDRKNKPFVNVNCAGLPANLVESELFGREKGAFTGSTARQIGRFELADGGTIFLDEIGELPVELQAKLLKVIEEGEFERLGSPKTVKVDVRIIASTNRNLEEEMKKGRFRQDLYYRLNVFPISIPPLRLRRGDITLLVKAYAEKFSKKYNKDIKRLPATIIQFLENYHWPGNVRELINVIERAVIVTDGPELMLADRMEAFSAEAEPAHDAAKQHDAIYTRYRAEIATKEQIMSALDRTGWRVEGPRGAAVLLGINPSTLRTRMKRLGIVRPGC